MLVARNLHKIYTNGAKELHVLKGIDLEVERGKVISIVGHSGAGKSTLLHLLGGLDRPSQGRVEFGGASLYAMDDGQRAKVRNGRMGFVFQFYHLLPEFTALENVMLPGLVAGVSPKRTLLERAEGLLSEIGLSERMTHKPAKLSGGEQQRVAIARALVNEPEIVFCDEPTGNLDSATGEAICQLIWSLNREKAQTFVIVSHEPEIAKRADKRFRIHDGILTEEHAYEPSLH